MSWAWDLWRRAAPGDLPRTTTDTLPLAALFPSARRAIAQCLADADLTATSLVGYPRFVSACVPRAIKTVATPVCIGQLAGDYDTRLDGLLVHEQWGWPLPRPALDRVVERFSSRLLVVDRVDSADFGFRRLDYAQVAEVVSLSKTLGLLGGGLARRVSGYTPFHSTTETAGTRHALERLASGSTSEPYREFFKNSSQAIHPAVSKWVATHSIMASLEDERMLRQRNVRLVQASPLANGWPGWMDAAMSRGAGPGLAPVLRGCEPDTWTKVMRLLAERFETASTVGVFNWTGDPLAPAYEACLLIPVHGEMQHVAEVVRSVVALLEL